MPADAKPTEPGADGQPLSFEQILERLETVVASLEQGDAPLEDALAKFEQGIALARQGARRLDEAERRIEVLMRDENDGLRARPLEKDSADDE